ncbi:hypothetical protein FB550_11989 [Neobacillus bataviensis]|uniref:Uncharacterized protein n=1 Tax=Neobacillus bataviensis TaxID=220685 RepID=A0A561CND8_9BACI|nr:hypothetical protein FB550_11989 [Neobacillus bataviensis]
MFIVEGLVQKKGTFTKVNVKFFNKSDKIGIANASSNIYNKINLFGNGGGEELKRSIFARLQWLEALFIVQFFMK